MDQVHGPTLIFNVNMKIYRRSGYEKHRLPIELQFKSVGMKIFGVRNALDLLYLKMSLWPSHLWERDPRATRF